MAAQGRDIKLSTQRVEGYRNFATKLWNAARFAEMNGCVDRAGLRSRNRRRRRSTAGSRTRPRRAAREVTEAIEAYRFNEAADAAYRFVWNVYCDWYLELAKPVLTGADGAAKAETRAMVAWARDEILKLLHPFMPFITEELWAVTAERRPARDGLLALARWPKHDGLDDREAEAEIGWVVDLVTAIRSVRAEMNIATRDPAGAGRRLGGDRRRAPSAGLTSFKRLARLSEISFAERAPQGSVQLVVRGEVAALPLKGVIDLAAEKARLEKELAKGPSRHRARRRQARQPEFVARAPEEVVEGESEKREEAEARREKILEALERLKGAA